MRKLLFISSILFCFILLFNATLWDNKAKDIYNRKVYYNIGDAIVILVDEQSAYDYKSSTKSTKSFKLNISGGGQISGQLNFVPTGNVEENKNSQDKDNLNIKTSINGLITNITNNYITIRGTKSITINNKTAAFEIAGDANLSDIIGNSISSNKIINLTFRFTTLIDNGKDVITAKDFTNQVLNPEATSDIMSTTKFSDDKKKEMLIRYFNKILNVIF